MVETKPFERMNTPFPYLLLLTAACTGQPFAQPDDQTEIDTPAVTPSSELLPGADAFSEDVGIGCHLSRVTGSASEVAMTLENHGDLAVSILRRSTAWDHAARVFSVTHESENVPYLGPVAYRLPPVDAEFDTLLPGEDATVTYDISREYKVTEPGEYLIALASSVLNARVGGTDLVLQHDCGVLSAPLEPDLIGQADQALQFPQPSGFTCSAPDQALILINNELARQQPPKVKAQLSLNFASIAGIYQRWFGSYDPNNAADVARLNLVVQILADIQGADNADQGPPTSFHWNADCRRDSLPQIDCNNLGQNNTAVAWGQYGTFTLHFCQAFLVSNPGWVGQNGSLPAVVIHEKAHEVDNRISGPTMETYGHDGCINLAISNPDAASKNAENYMFFVADAYVTNAAWVPATSPLY